MRDTRAVLNISIDNVVNTKYDNDNNIHAHIYRHTHTYGCGRNILTLITSGTGNVRFSSVWLCGLERGYRFKLCGTAVWLQEFGEKLNVSVCIGNTVSGKGNKFVGKLFQRKNVTVRHFARESFILFYCFFLVLSFCFYII